MREPIPRRGICLFLFSFSSLLCGASSGRVLSPTEIADHLKLYRNIATLRTKFTQTKIIHDLDVRVVSDGSLFLSRPSKVVWQITRPAPMQLAIEGKRVTMETGAGAERKTETWSLDSRVDERTSKSLLGMVAWLSIDVPAIQAAYEVSRLDSGEFRCVPRDLATSPFIALRLKLHPRGHLERLTIEEKSQDVIEIAFSAPEITRGK